MIVMRGWMALAGVGGAALLFIPSFKHILYIDGNARLGGEMKVIWKVWLLTGLWMRLGMTKTGRWCEWVDVIGR